MPIMKAAGAAGRAAGPENDGSGPSISTPGGSGGGSGAGPSGSGGESGRGRPRPEDDDDDDDDNQSMPNCCNISASIRCFPLQKPLSRRPGWPKAELLAAC
ncbi:hypothetical protein Vretifemale_16612 [Volvox reticuliferus]|uniref:Uncharacterized protein n=1 Tax=Volvox reticuliferus TaxID=1737510 RepID=A0A8J4CU44_9CHLO|nr:hypothetical protein Vretifemale_16612 [Volvox reticuliferus]